MEENNKDASRQQALMSMLASDEKNVAGGVILV